MSKSGYYSHKPKDENELSEQEKQVIHCFEKHRGNYGKIRIRNPDTFTYKTTIGKIADINYAIIYKALCKYSIFKFNIIKIVFPEFEIN